MYVPEHFAETNAENIAWILEKSPLAIVIAHTPKGLVANHIPLLMEGEDKLIGHIALANDLHRHIEDETDVLVIFRADDAYISPNWYPSKKEDGKQVPTWNYRVVHVEGRITFLHDSKNKRAIVGKLTKYFETLTNADKGWKMADAPKDYMESQISKIVGFEIEISKIMGKSKLNQNKSVTDRQEVALNLEKRNKLSLSKSMTEKKFR